MKKPDAPAVACRRLPPIMMMRKGYTYVRLPYNAGYDELLADQRIQAGDMCIRGTRIPASSIYGRFRSGEGLEFIARDYKITKKQVEAAIDYVGYSANSEERVNGQTK